MKTGPAHACAGPAQVRQHAHLVVLEHDLAARGVGALGEGELRLHGRHAEGRQHGEQVAAGHIGLHGGGSSCWSYIWRNKWLYASLTGRCSLRCLSLICRWPRRSRLTPAMALTLTSVERWICQNRLGSSSSTSSLIGLRMSDSAVG